MLKTKQGQKRKSVLIIQTRISSNEYLREGKLRRVIISDKSASAFSKDVMLRDPEQSLKVDASVRLCNLLCKYQYPRGAE
jgi:hypothetical protein